MNCKYSYREGDSLVKAGLKTIGEVCGIKMGSEEYGGYCPAHARTMGTMPVGALEKEKERRAITKEEQRKRKESAMDGVESNLGKTDNPIVNAAVLEAMGLKDPCNLAEEYAVLKAVNAKETYINYAEKMAFARWLESPQHLRNPKTIDEAADVLGVKVRTLFVWKNTPEVIDFINMDTEKRALGMFPMAIYKLGVNIDRGDVKSIQTLLDYCAKKNEEKTKSRKALNIPDEMLKEANDYAQSTAIDQNKGAALAAEKSMVITNHFNESMISEKEN